MNQVSPEKPKDRILFSLFLYNFTLDILKKDTTEKQGNPQRDSQKQQQQKPDPV